MLQILLSLMLFLAGCGVMNNPKRSGDQSKGAEDSAMDAGSNAMGLPYAPAMVYVPVAKLPVNSETAEFTALYRDAELLTDRNSSVQFLTDLNTTAREILPSEAYADITTWFTAIRYTDYTRYNVLFYPLVMEQDCNLTVSSDNNRTFTIDRYGCRAASTYYPLFFKIDKQIPEVVLQFLGERNVTIENR